MAYLQYIYKAILTSYDGEEHWDILESKSPVAFNCVPMLTSVQFIEEESWMITAVTSATENFPAVTSFTSGTMDKVLKMG